MTRYRVDDLYIEVHEQELAAHDGAYPPPNDVSEWYGGDLVAAINEGIVEVEHDEIDLVDAEVVDAEVVD